MASTSATFKVRFPEFADVDDARIQLFLDDAAALMGNRTFCGNYDVAQCYLAAHLLTVAEQQAAGDSGVLAPISKQEVDDVVIEQAVKPSGGGGGSGMFDSTSYGKMFLHYQKICFGGLIIGV